MEEEEDPFCFRSLKRERKKHTLEENQRGQTTRGKNNGKGTVSPKKQAQMRQRTRHRSNNTNVSLCQNRDSSTGRNRNSERGENCLAITDENLTHLTVDKNALSNCDADVCLSETPLTVSTDQKTTVKLEENKAPLCDNVIKDKYKLKGDDVANRNKVQKTGERLKHGPGLYSDKDDLKYCLKRQENGEHPLIMSTMSNSHIQWMHTSPSQTSSKYPQKTYPSPQSKEHYLPNEVAQVPPTGLPDITDEKVLPGPSPDSHKTTRAEDGRCPFCQVPFQALCGQSPNWHTMECMDIPLTATEECPKGLKCDNTIPSHFRHYSHKLMAVHLAGQGQDQADSCSDVHADSQESNPGLLSEGSPSTEDKTTKKSSQQSQNSQQESQGKITSAKQTRPKKRKSLSLKTKGHSAKSQLSQSQGSPKDSVKASHTSIMSYFSPKGKNVATFSTDKPQKHKEKDTDEELDPVLRILVMSDSDNEEYSNTDSDERRVPIVAVESKDISNPENPETMVVDLSELDDWSEEELGDKEKTGVAESCDSESVQESVDTGMEETSAGDEKQGNETLLGVLNSEGNTEQQAVKLQPAVTTPSISTTPFPLQKQTSLFSFFKPQCHSASTSRQPTACNNGIATNKQLFTKNMDRKRKSFTFSVTRPPLSKSASEPAKVVRLRVPSPPACATPNNVSHTHNTARPQWTGKGRQAATTATASFQNSSGRSCPFYKKITGTSITVDAFCYGVIPGCQAYVLTHFHYDHYRGLTKRFSQPMYCSPVTANLVEKQIGVASRWVNRLPLNTPSQVAGVWLTLMEANHCPGAAIILFELPNGRKMLHTGDFRADPCMEQYPPLLNVAVDELYLDTTYCDPAYTFPSQQEAIEFAVSTAVKAMKQEPRTLVVCGAYTIGKERIFIALAEALQTKVCVQSAKKRVLDCLEDDRLKNMISLKWTDGCVHVLPMKQLNARGLETHLQQYEQFSSILAFEPTGWTHSNRTLSLDTLRPKFTGRGITIYGVPYSEHSSFLEMKRFVQFLRPKKILPTVNNGNPTSRRKMETIFAQWLSEGTSHSRHAGTKDPAQLSLGTWLKK